MLVYKGKYIEFQIRKITSRFQLFPLKFSVTMITPQPTYLFKSSSETVFYIGQGSRNYKISTILLLKQDLSNDNNS